MESEQVSGTEAPAESGSAVPAVEPVPSETPTPGALGKSLVSSAGGAADAENPAEEVSEGQTEEGAAHPAEAPAEYEFDVPEGVELDQEVLGEFAELARARNLSQAEASAFVDLGVKLASRWAAQLEEAEKATREAWAKELASDPTFSGDARAGSMALIARARDAVASEVPGLAELLDEHGLGNHPTVVRLFRAFGKLVSEDQTVISPSSRGAAVVPLEDRLYTATRR